MTILDIEAPLQPLPVAAEAVEPAAPVQVQGKFFFVGNMKHFVKGVTYGPFPKASHGEQFPELAMVEIDFALMAPA
jgi:hypothetical protein